jgi:ADP-ribose pyrophosphatase YjhB (NUDIX family)
MKYCSECGAQVALRIPAGDDRMRYVCVSCKLIHYQNPRIVAGSLPVWQDRVLLCKRAIEPRYGYWTLPAGFMELRETTIEAALRETLEEANARINIQSLYVVINLPQVDQVYMMFRSELLDLDFSPGAESLEVKLCSQEEIPWNDIAFGTIRHTLLHYFTDRETGEYPLHVGDIIKEGDRFSYRPGPGRH